jgi:hypothetical protein
MGDILPFVAKVRASGDWTAAERARLEDLADQFSAGGAPVEVVFGTTEDGDPWCVVKDDQEEVLVHVARIGGRFVVHYAVEDALEEGADLHAALNDRLAAVEAEDDVVVPFSIGGRHAQTFIALVVATAFFYETQDLAVAAEAGDSSLQMLPEAEPAPELAAGDDLGVRQDRDLTANGSMFAEAAPAASGLSVAPTAAPASAVAALSPDEEPESAEVEVADAPEETAPQDIVLATAAAPVRNEITGTDDDDHLVGTAGADHIRGGAGADTLQGGGASAGQVDLLEGGDGDDRIELNAQVVATGGEGADTFVIQAPIVMGDASTLLGVLTDFSEGEGDRLVNARGELVMTFPPTAGLSGPGAGQPAETSPAFTGPPTPPSLTTDRQVNVDLDGDGQVDGYVLFAHMREPFAAGEMLQPTPDEPFVLVRALFDYTEMF